MNIESWREDEFSEPSLDARFYTACGTTSSITEGEPYSLLLEQPEADIDFGLAGERVLVQAAVNPRKICEQLWLLPQAYRSFHHGFLVGFINRFECSYALVDPSAIALSRSSIDELTRSFHPGENISTLTCYVNEPPKLEAIYPLTSAIYEQLAGVPRPTRETIQLVLSQFAMSLYPVAPNRFPSLRLAALEDSSYLLEWIFDDRRLGFSFEPNPKDSGWYFVFSAVSSAHFESGTMDQLEMSRLIKMMLKR